MYATLNELKEINDVQIEILKATANVCELLGIRWFMVHGSLLGTIRNGAFIPYDDDIDIAMKRDDYERFLKEAPKLLGEHYFLQSYKSDKKYPLLFAKIRDNRTTYVCDTVKHIPMNHGIYIDIFPIDNALKSNNVEPFLKKIYQLRVSASLHLENASIMQKLKRLAVRFLCPSAQFALKKLNSFYVEPLTTGYVCFTGGKSSESALPIEWFEKLEKRTFEGIPVWVPSEYDQYLRVLYGDYENRTLVEGKMCGEKVELNACIVDVTKSYLSYGFK